MTDPTSPFAERKSSRWVWIVPSVLLHVVVLMLWLSMPEEEPRKPGQRELTIDAEQAELLQELVEDSNLRELRADIAEMQAIKRRMAQIRAEKMEGLQSFEETMLREAPRDVAGLISEILAMHESMRELNERTMDTLGGIRKASAPVEKLVEKDPVAAIQALEEVAPLRNGLEGVRDQLEESTNTAKAVSGSIRARMEWISDPETLERINRFLDEVEEMNEGLNSLNRELGGSVDGRPRRFLNELIAEEKSSIDTLRAYDEMEAGAEAKQARKETEEDIQSGKQELAGLRKELATNRERIKTLDGKERNGLARTIKNQEGKINGLERRISRNELRLERKEYLPDGSLKKDADRIRWKLGEAFGRPADLGVFETFEQRQAAFVRKANELRTTLEAM